MELAPCTDDDLALTIALETDPQTMRFLGGAVSLASAQEAHRRRMREDTRDWWLKVVPEPGEDAGFVGIWLSDWQDRKIHEAAWMLLPEFRGRGIAREAVGMLLDRTRAEPSMTQIHAFPNVENAPSNGLCRSLGFTDAGESDVEFRGTPLRVRHWVIGVEGS